MFWLGVLGQLLLAGLGGMVPHGALSEAPACEPFDGLRALPGCVACALEGAWPACARLPQAGSGAGFRIAWPSSAGGVWIRIGPMVGVGAP